jgi:hypothetical protein
MTSGNACVAPGAQDWTTVEVTGTGPVTVTARWSLAAAVRPTHAPTRCPPNRLDHANGAEQPASPPR